MYLAMVSAYADAIGLAKGAKPRQQLEEASLEWAIGRGGVPGVLHGSLLFMRRAKRESLLNLSNYEICFSGLTGSRSLRSSKWSCGELTVPLCPTLPIGCPF